MPTPGSTAQRDQRGPCRGKFKVPVARDTAETWNSCLRKHNFTMYLCNPTYSKSIISAYNQYVNLRYHIFHLFVIYFEIHSVFYILKKGWVPLLAESCLPPDFVSAVLLEQGLHRWYLLSTAAALCHCVQVGAAHRGYMLTAWFFIEEFCWPMTWSTSQSGLTTCQELHRHRQLAGLLFPHELGHFRVLPRGL